MKVPAIPNHLLLVFAFANPRFKQASEACVGEMRKPLTEKETIFGWFTISIGCMPIAMLIYGFSKQFLG